VIASVATTRRHPKTSEEYANFTSTHPPRPVRLPRRFFPPSNEIVLFLTTVISAFREASDNANYARIQEDPGDPPPLSLSFSLYVEFWTTRFVS